MDSSKAVTATFTELATYTLTTNASPPEGGSISPVQPYYTAGQTVTITATANSGYTFDQWSGAATGSGITTTLTMDSNKAVTATFVGLVPTYTLTTNASPPEGGSISPVQPYYTAGQTVTITATANSGYTFTNWSGSSTDTDPSITLTMDSNKSVTANFIGGSGGEDKKVFLPIIIK
jgi:uncharacterized repeat protein (TIGR02543 family)